MSTRTTVIEKRAKANPDYPGKTIPQICTDYHQSLNSSSDYLSSRESLLAARDFLRVVWNTWGPSTTKYGLLFDCCVIQMVAIVLMRIDDKLMSMGHTEHDYVTRH